MKTLFLTGLLAAGALSVSAQPTAPVFLASTSGEYKMALAKTTIHLSEWHEETFWNQFEQYVREDVQLSDRIYQNLDKIGSATKTTINDERGTELGAMVLRDRFAQLDLWQKYFNEISAAHNGVIALKFVQTEILLDLLESARTYEQTQLTSFRYQGVADTTTSLPIEKRTLLKAALVLSDDECMPFFADYMKYEDECDDLFGWDYSLIASFADEPSDYTPAQAKLVGNSLLEVVRRELKLKEKYFNAIASHHGGSLAARFLAWEDYYSLVSKIDAWADAP